MKRFLLIIASLFVGGIFLGGSKTVAQNAQQLTLEDITGGKYNLQYVYGVNPMKDGESYTQLSDDSKRIIRRSFKTGKEIEVLFDADQARGDAKLKAIDATSCRPTNAAYCCVRKLSPFTAAHTLPNITYMMCGTKSMSLCRTAGRSKCPFSRPMAMS